MNEMNKNIISQSRFLNYLNIEGKRKVVETFRDTLRNIYIIKHMFVKRFSNTSFLMFVFGAVSTWDVPGMVCYALPAVWLAW